MAFESGSPSIEGLVGGRVKMTCEEFKSWFSPYLDDELDEMQEAEFDSHLKECVHCRDEINVQRKLDTLVQNFMEAEAPKDLLRRILEKVPVISGGRKIFAGWSIPFAQPQLKIALAFILIMFVVTIPVYRKMFTPRAIEGKGQTQKTESNPQPETIDPYMLTELNGKDLSETPTQIQAVSLNAQEYVSVQTAENKTGNIQEAIQTVITPEVSGTPAL